MVWQSWMLEERGGIFVGRELDTAICQVHQLSWNIALPQPSQAFMLQYLLQGAQSPFVNGAIDAANAKGVGERVYLEL
jgi:hypothetical protein